MVAPSEENRLSFRPIAHAICGSQRLPNNRDFIGTCLRNVDGPVKVVWTREEDIQHTAIEKQLMAWHKSNPLSQRLASVPGIGPIIATALAATVVEPSGFRSGREARGRGGLGR